ncbi:transglutaminaseTgpA domain-containing protein [Cyanobium sp. FACHB-13342]|uniref:transglutaminase TgpA family protein n=1 Tax=Cyanobium sp. FACHB-13342 TaxID=2692793 RepID=UPI0016800DDE|nr:transglutaminaseTgpA domain-containing protein [Cyanobium sp. FACHB-13342]MBD2424003.1 DUF3488 domain-containing protein [Cyanobium sp. FACHB-13342]
MSRSARWLQILGLAVLAAGLPGLDYGSPLGWLSAGLLLLAALKLAEARSVQERRLVSLLTLIGCGVQGAQQPELLPSVLQLLGTGLALAGLLALEVGEGLSWRAVLRRSLAVLLAALPMALLLFLLVPRLDPLWTAPSLRGPGAAVTGLSADLDPGSIASLANDEAPAARVSFSSATPPDPQGRYWRVIVHERFDGRRWSRLDEPAKATVPPANAPSSAADQAGPSQVWLVEPSPVHALPWAGTGQGSSSQLRVSRNGELRRQLPGRERLAYLLRDVDRPQAWQQRPPTLVDLSLPAGSNPQLESLGESWRTLPQPEQRLAAAQAWFTSHTFRYSRTPGALPARRGLDVFLFERREGFCGHYASAFTALMRSAGVPARVVSGYLGGRWVQPLGGTPYLDLRQSDAHAWSEVWLPNRGWQRVDPSAWVGSSASNPVGVVGSAAAGSSKLEGWRLGMQWLQWQWWGLDLAWNRWWLGFDQASQEALLRRLFGDQRQGLGLVLLGGAGGLLALGLGWLQWLQTPERGDRLERDLHAVLRLLRRWGIEPAPGETFGQLCLRARERLPGRREALQELSRCHGLLRFARLNPTARARHWAAWRTALRTLQHSP